MSPEAREVAKISNEILSAGRRLRNLAKKFNYQNAAQREYLEKGLREIGDRI